MWLIPMVRVCRSDNSVQGHIQLDAVLEQGILVVHDDSVVTVDCPSHSTISRVVWEVRAKRLECLRSPVVPPGNSP